MNNMTIEQTLKNMLCDSGMFEDQADAVLELVKADPANSPMNGRWNEAREGYPDVLITMLWIATKDHALEWIDANLPLAWYRPMFVTSTKEQ